MKRSALVERDFKLRFGLKLCLLIVVGMFALTAVLYLVTTKTLGASYGEAIYAIYALRINIFSLVFASFYSIFILMVITLLIAAISIFFSHKMAGPIYRLEKNLDLVGSGDLTVLTRFRATDQLSPLAEEKNRMVRSLNHTVRSTGEALSDIEAVEKRLFSLLAGKELDVKALVEEMQGLKFGIEELKKAASGVKVGGK